ncbi:MAG: hypothetical protein K2R93_08845 [Gemmatimonadaceae bacterium]|nr:hypothetical protein [Gemmatimonadaceae bacterium]
MSRDTEEFCVPELASIGLDLKCSTLNRGVLILGASGTGKSRSAILPILAAVRQQWERSEKGKRDCMLVIDPKRELIKSMDDHVLILGQEGSIPIRFYDDSIDRSDAGVLLDEALALSPGATPFARDPFWRSSARSLLRACLLLDTTVHAEATCEEEARLQQQLLWRALAKVFDSRAGGKTGATESLLQNDRPWSRYMALCRLLQRTSNDTSELLPQQLAQVIKLHVPTYNPADLLSVHSLAPETGTSVVGTVASVLGPLTDSRVQDSIDFDPSPWPSARYRLSMDEAIRDGLLMAYQPREISDENAMIGRAIKRAYLRAIIRGAACDAHGVPQRRAFYIADEFQRFIGGEEMYFDVMRSASGHAIVASQSQAALVQALGPGKELEAQAIMENLSTRVQFMSPDPHTTNAWLTLISRPPVVEYPHVLTVRPISMLKTGQAYWFSEGRFGYGQVRLQ